MIYVTLANRVYDVTTLNHPGGRVIIEHVYGRDIERFLFGAYAIELSNMSTHLHSKRARLILESFFIGEFEPYEGHLITPALRIPESNIS